MKILVFFLMFTVFSNASFAVEKNATQVIEVKVTENGFEPNNITVSDGTPVVLKVTRQTEATCATEILIKNKKIKKELPIKQTVTIDLGKIKKGDLAFACPMDMFKGTIHSK